MTSIRLLHSRRSRVGGRAIAIALSLVVLGTVAIPSTAAAAEPTLPSQEVAAAGAPEGAAVGTDTTTRVAEAPMPKPAASEADPSDEAAMEAAPTGPDEGTAVNDAPDLAQDREAASVAPGVDVPTDAPRPDGGTNAGGDVDAPARLGDARPQTALAPVAAAATTTTLTVSAPAVVWAGSWEFVKATLSQAGTPVSGFSVDLLAGGNVVDQAWTQSDGSAYFQWTPPEELGTVILAARADAPYEATSQPLAVPVHGLPVITMTASPEAIPTVGGTTTLKASVAHATGGRVTWARYDHPAATWREMGESTVDATGRATFEATVEPGGSWFSVDYFPPERDNEAVSHGSLTVTARHDTVISMSLSPTTVSANDSEIVITARTTRRPDADGWTRCALGTLTFTDTVAGTQSGLGEVEAGCETTFKTRFSTSGTHTVAVAYSGDAEQAPATTSINFTVLPDVAVRASAVGRDLATFYPVKDGHRDSLAISGNRAEPISVGIRVKNAAGRVVRSLSVPTGVGRYQVAWNGRTASGALVAAGSYRIVQTLRDRAGNTRAYSSYTEVSHKRLTWLTGTLTRNGDDYDRQSHTELAVVSKTKSSYAHGVQFRANRDHEYANAVWDFTLPKAVRYGKLTFKAHGAAKAGYGTGYMAIWADEDMDRYSLHRPYGWNYISEPFADHHFGRRVTGEVGVNGRNLGRHDIAKVRLTFKYAVLR